MWDRKEAAIPANDNNDDDNDEEASGDAMDGVPEEDGAVAVDDEVGIDVDADDVACDGDVDDDDAVILDINKEKG